MLLPFCFSTPTCRSRNALSVYVGCKKISDLWSAKIQLFILTSETIIPFKVVSLVMHTLLPVVLPLLKKFLESFLCNLVQLGRRVPHNVFSFTQVGYLSAAFSVWGIAKNHKEPCRESREPDESGECCL